MFKDIACVCPAPTEVTTGLRASSWRGTGEKDLAVWWREPSFSLCYMYVYLLGAHTQYLPCSSRANINSRWIWSPPPHTCVPKSKSKWGVDKQKAVAELPLGLSNHPGLTGTTCGSHITSCWWYLHVGWGRAVCNMAVAWWLQFCWGQILVEHTLLLFLSNIISCPEEKVWVLRVQKNFQAVRADLGARETQACLH